MDQEIPEDPKSNKRQKISTVPKAIRCDRNIPCSNCEMTKIACQPADPAEKRPSTVQINDLQNHINALESRLQILEANPNTRHHTSQHLANRQLPSVPQADQSVVSISETPYSLYEGESSFTSQSLGAREAAQSLANPNRPQTGSNLNVAFNSLNGLLQPSQKTRQGDESRSYDPVQIPLALPAELVIALLRRFQEEKPLFLSSYPINDLRLVERLCQKVYFPTRDVSAGDVAAMHGVLYWLIREYSYRNDAFCKKFDLKTHFKNCKSRFEADIKNHDVIAVPSFENVIALAMGILKAQDEANPLMGCHLISTAVRHCQMLGYHRESAYKNPKDEDASNKRRIFWTIYVFDKTMSLLLGRASYLQDFDMDVKTPAASSDPAISPWDEAFYWMIKLAEVQGNTYNKLYSPAAIKHSSQERLNDINNLKAAIEECRHGRDNIEFTKANQQMIFEISSKTWELLYYSVLTSILRASTSTDDSEIGPECFRAARKCLLSHLECFPSYNESGLFSVADYANWVQSYSSFTPFIVIFLHSIAASSMEDVKLLEEIVKTLQQTRGVSSASERMYNICANFVAVSRDLVEAQKSCVGKYDEQRDALELFNDSQYGHLFFSDSQQEDPGFDMTAYLTHPEVQNMSAVLEGWDSGQQSAMEVLGVDLGNSS
ncbi:uncharacterized protein N7506_003501 [Penicillium brevicompactum]|uniref:uncharacterized protein n=1 Tax=Penicillium brevicompactum TaxID=5074 RepID=UPI00253F9756|nr:uncharacterized protein N7506_003501 [Penicillium brevicompactum]KAJ5343677.1 hypothetical protein N7506_003501 [Penicillium brevicompactum]